MIQELKIYKTADLVLNVSQNYDPQLLDLTPWDRYLDVLCSTRTYQKNAIKRAIEYLVSGLYNSIEDLIASNWQDSKNVELKTRYQSLSEYQNHLNLKEKLSGTVDLATGTGKSYVIYGIAQIMLGLGAVDNVLVLCPSLTIEDGLFSKFRKLAQDPELLNAIPESAKIKNPAIKDANVTIKSGDICVENIHAAYDKASSSIKQSFEGKGHRTLVLNDEAHHIYTQNEGRDKESQSLKKWKSFLMNPSYNFKYILGFTGTAYINNDYFNDVFFRYSLRDALNDSIIKMVDYVSDNDDSGDQVKFQEILDNHNQNKLTYRRVRPLTILITKDISSAKRLLSEFCEFLVKFQEYSFEECQDKTLIVTSSEEHRSNLIKLREVDNDTSLVEFIISVSMLTEGWDVKNVFQIVPWEDRAFNSKLLIAQVLGRGLRLPDEYQNPQPKVRVFNHSSWSRNIKGLVDEVLEIEMKLTSTCLPKTSRRSEFNFDVYHVDYNKIPVVKEAKSPKENIELDYTKGFVTIFSQTGAGSADKESEYTTLRGDKTSKVTVIKHDLISIDELVNKIYFELRIREWEGKILKLPTGDYTKAKLPPKQEIKKIIRTSMEKVGIMGDGLVETNAYKILNSFNTLLRKSSNSTVYEKKVNSLFTQQTSKIEKESIAVGNLRHFSTVFYSTNYMSEIVQEESDILSAVIEDETFPKSSSKEINEYLFKTPIDIVFTKYEPERKFIEQLCKPDNSAVIDAWIKSRDHGFYSIEYSFRPATHQKIANFNPDFIIKLRRESTEHFVFVETKADNDLSIENKAKLKYANLHFEYLNNELSDQNINQQYHFHFLSPISYSVFFDYLKSGQLLDDKFRSELEDKLEGFEVS